MASLKLSATDEMIRCCRAVLAAAETSLAEEGLPLPESRYVSVQGGDWIVGVDCEDCCSQLIVTPLVEVTRFNDPTTVAAGARDSRQAYARLTTWEISVSGPVNLAVLTNRLRLGTVAQAPTAASNENTHWSETVPIIAARWALVRNIERNVRDELCAAGINCRLAIINLVTPWMEGGCAGTKVTVQVQQ